jgi:hypothetical protein
VRCAQSSSTAHADRTAILKTVEMQYRRLGRAGVKVSVLSFGSWVTFGPQLAGDTARECLAAAFDSGMNFFDNAEVYARGRSEEIMGAAIKELRWPRHAYLISTKFFWGIEDWVNTRSTLNRKYLLQAIDGSLRRLVNRPLPRYVCSPWSGRGCILLARPGQGCDCSGNGGRAYAVVGSRFVVWSSRCVVCACVARADAARAAAMPAPAPTKVRREGPFGFSRFIG